MLDDEYAMGSIRNGGSAEPATCWRKWAARVGMVAKGAMTDRLLVIPVLVWLVGSIALPNDAVATQSACALPESHLERLICGDLEMRRLAEEVDAQYQARISGAAPAELAGLHIIYNEWLSLIAQSCGRTVGVSVPSGDLETIRVCLVQRYQKGISSLLAPCRRDRERSLAEMYENYLRTTNIMPQGSGNNGKSQNIDLSNIPREFVVVEGVKRFKVADYLAMASIYQFPLEGPDDESNIQGSIRGDGVLVASCVIRGPSGAEWMAIRRIDGSLFYIKFKDTQEWED
jgi:hypothetical protein